MSDRRTTLTLLLLALPGVLRAQERDTAFRRQSLPRDVRREAAAIYNAAAPEWRKNGPVDVGEGERVPGDLAVLNGPIMIAGHVAGRVLAINADVILKPTARIDGDLLVVGGEVEGRNAAYVGGEIRIYRQSLHYEQVNDTIAPTRDTLPADEDPWWRRWERRRSRSSSKLQIASAGAYNRVEGLPVDIGPESLRRTPWGRVRFDAYAIVRTGSSFSSTQNDVGHDVRGEVDYGHRDGVGVGGRLYSVVDGVEDWQLTNLEVGLASFLFHRDYRDYYQRHGASVFGALFARHGARLTGSYGEERWFARDIHDPFTLFRSDLPWRANPLLDEGRFHVGDLAFRLDTRNDEDRPRAGWYMVADYEHGAGNLTYVAPASVGRRSAPGPTAYNRGFLDVRRYNQISPDAQLNLRLVAGGWLGGDELPLERRLSVEGAGVLPGFGFRSPRPGVDVGTCSVSNGAGGIAGRPAECERIALGQVEYRGNLRFDFGGGWDDERSHRRRFPSLRTDLVWVLFADGGRGWLVNAAPNSLVYGRGQIPPLSSFRTDIGGGLDFGEIGVYVAKAVSVSDEPARVFVRLRRRF